MLSMSKCSIFSQLDNWSCRSNRNHFLLCRSSYLYPSSSLFLRRRSHLLFNELFQCKRLFERRLLSITRALSLDGLLAHLLLPSLAELCQKNLIDLHRSNRNYLNGLIIAINPRIRVKSSVGKHSMYPKTHSRHLQAPSRKVS